MPGKLKSEEINLRNGALTYFPIGKYWWKTGNSSKSALLCASCTQKYQRGRKEGRMEAKGRRLAEGQEMMQKSHHTIYKAHTVLLDPTCTSWAFYLQAGRGGEDVSFSQRNRAVLLILGNTQEKEIEV